MCVLKVLESFKKICKPKRLKKSFERSGCPATVGPSLTKFLDELKKSTQSQKILKISEFWSISYQNFLLIHLTQYSPNALVI